jgi:Fis family transcriptional regulator
VTFGGESMTRTRSRKRQSGAQKAAANGHFDFADADHRPLHRCVASAMDGYFAALDGATMTGLYDLVIAEVERPLLESVMRFAGDNQSRAAEILGLNRGTLRKKLKLHGLMDE